MIIVKKFLNKIIIVSIYLFLIVYNQNGYAVHEDITAALDKFDAFFIEINQLADEFVSSHPDITKKSVIQFILYSNLKSQLQVDDGDSEGEEIDMDLMKLSEEPYQLVVNGLRLRYNELTNDDTFIPLGNLLEDNNTEEYVLIELPTQNVLSLVIVGDDSINRIATLPRNLRLRINEVRVWLNDFTALENRDRTPLVLLPETPPSNNLQINNRLSITLDARLLPGRVSAAPRRCPRCGCGCVLL